MTAPDTPSTPHPLALKVADKINAVCFDITNGYDAHLAASFIEEFAEAYHAERMKKNTGVSPWPMSAAPKDQPMEDKDKAVVISCKTCMYSYYSKLMREPCMYCVSHSHWKKPNKNKSK